MPRILLALFVALALAPFGVHPAAAYHDHPCEDVRDATGLATCWPFWYVECLQERPLKTKLACLDSGELHLP